MVPLWEYYLRAIFILLTTIGNLLVIHAIFKIRKYRRASHGLLLNLFFSDALAGFTVMAVYMINLIANRNIFSEPMCYFTALLKTCMTLFSLYALALLCIERLFMLKFPIKHRKMFSSVRPFILIVIVLSLSIPSLAVSTFEVVYFPKQHLCWFNLEEVSFVSVFLILIFGVPALALVVSSLVIIKTIKQPKHVGTKLVVPGGESDNTQGNKSTPSRCLKSKKNLRTYFMVVLMVSTFLFCHIPNMITFFCELSNHCQISERLTVCSKFLHFSKNFLNTVIYGLLNKKVRENLYVLLRRKFLK